MADPLSLVIEAPGLPGGSMMRQLRTLGQKVRALVLPDDPAISSMPLDMEYLQEEFLDHQPAEVNFAR